MHYYSVFDRIVLSEIRLPDLPQTEPSNPEVSIKYGTVSQDSNAEDEIGIGFRINGNCVYVYIRDLVKICIEAHGLVTVEPGGNIDDYLLRQIIYNNVIGVALLWRDDFLLTGCVAYTEYGKAVVFLSPHPVMSSELVLLLSRNAYRIYSDGFFRIMFQANKPFVTRGYPFIQVWKDTLNKLNLDPGDFARVRPGLDKYRYILETVPATVEIGTVFILNKDKRQNSVKVVEEEQKNGLFRIMQHAYKKEYLVEMKKLGTLMKQAELLSRNVKVYQLRYANCFDQFDQILCKLRRD